VNTLLLDKTGTITLGNRQASEFIPAPGVSAERLADAAQLSSLPDETPEGKSIVTAAHAVGVVCLLGFTVTAFLALIPEALGPVDERGAR